MTADHFVYWSFQTPALPSHLTLRLLQLFFLSGMAGPVEPRGCGLYFSFLFFSFFFCASVFVFEAVGCHLKPAGAVQWL